MQTTALVGMNGSIDWFCYPYFDSPSVFCAILDDAKGGRFKIAPVPDGVKSKQYYWPDTNVLVTRFHTPAGVGRVIDFMPVGVRTSDCIRDGLIRRVQAIRKSMTFRLECRPAFNYGRESHTLTITRDGARFQSSSLTLRLGSTIPLTQDGDGIFTEFTLQEGEEIDFCLQEVESGHTQSTSCPETHAEELFKHTVDYWRRWLSNCTYTGRWREMVHRSALVLKLLTFQPTGAIVAAPTCSLPEEIGGVRNWDYRYTWIRDAAFTLYGLLRIGFTEEASAFMHWLEARCHELNPDGSLQLMYGIDGRHQLTEEPLTHLEGYRGSRPVRVGNGAYNQLQLDIYGELMDS
ncbi:MAG: glycoside hydrolase family 15 protein, partial [Nitrospira sp.]|nr:glycoside hydrolase family 15 protein [Nitrospira sp.]